MFRLIGKVAKKIGLPPGTLVHVGDRKLEKVRITVIDYDEDHFEEREVENVEECLAYKSKPTITWINIDGLHKVDVIEKIGKMFDLHSLILEDMVNTLQRPKIEDMGHYMSIVLKMLYHHAATNDLSQEQVSVIFGADFVITFQEREGDVFDPVRDRIRNGKGRIRKMGADYLACSLIDSVVDNYFILLDKIGDRMEELESSLVSDEETGSLQTIHQVRTELIFLRKAVWPLREITSTLERGEADVTREPTRIFFRNLYDHVIQVADGVETLRELVSGMHDLHLSNMSNRMNAIMKVLTIIATLFIPATFLAGIYGMNFKYMPELEWRYGYAIVWAIIFSVIIAMLVYFKRKKWL